VTDRSRLRLVILQVLVLSLLATLIARLWYVEVHQGATYRALAADVQIRHVVTTPVRGQILDDEGRPLVSNRTTLVLTLDRSVLNTRTSAQQKAELAALAAQLKEGPAAILAQITPCGSPGAAKPPVCWNGSPFQPVPIAQNVSANLALSIEQQAEVYPGVAVQLQAIRDYPQYGSTTFPANAAQILGYVGPANAQEIAATQNAANPIVANDTIGQAGLEQEYDNYLRGVNGVERLSIDRAGNVNGTLSQTDPIPGDNLVTNIDSHVQSVLEAQLAAAVARAKSQDPCPGSKGVTGPCKAESAAGVVLNVQTGAVVAMATLPTYNPSIWVGGISQTNYNALLAPSANEPLIDRAFQGGYAPGSTFKVVSSSAMLENGYSATSLYDCKSVYMVGNQPFYNDEGIGAGYLTLAGAIEKSCDTVFYPIAYDQWLYDGGLNPTHPRDIFIKQALAWGFGTDTGIDLPNENPGNITTRQSLYNTWKQMDPIYCKRAKTGYPEIAKTSPEHAAYLKALAVANCGPQGAQYKAGDAVNFVIGQGYTLTNPLKMAQVYAAIANGGILYQPQVAKAVLSPSGAVVTQFKPHVDGKLPISKSVLQFLQGALVGVTTAGTTRQQFADFPLNQISVASKTGTAEVQGQQSTSWVASYAPANKPKYAVVMMVSHGGYGSTTVGDSIKAVYQSLFGVKGTTVDPKLSVLPNAQLPTSLPVVNADGVILPPGSVVPRSPSTPPATATGTAAAASFVTGSGSGLPGLPAALGPPRALNADLARRLWVGDG
jgi:penicillin-binding protein 2